MGPDASGIPESRKNDLMMRIPRIPRIPEWLNSQKLCVLRFCESVLFMSKAITLSRKSSRQAWNTRVATVNSHCTWGFGDTKGWSRMDGMVNIGELWISIS